jgi:hypothetical protein
MKRITWRSGPGREGRGPVSKWLTVEKGEMLKKIAMSNMGQASVNGTDVVNHAAISQRESRRPLFNRTLVGEGTDSARVDSNGESSRGGGVRIGSKMLVVEAWVRARN